MKKSKHPNASTGPRSAEGKARSSMNALKSGIYSKSLVIPGEDAAHLTTLTEEYFQRFNPTLPEQRDLVDILVRSTWGLRRLAVAEAQVYTYQMDTAIELDEDSPIGQTFWLLDRTLSRLHRMVNSTQRNFRDALRDLERLQALPPDIQSSESSATNSDPSPAKAPQPVQTEPVNPSRQFVSSSSARPQRPAQKSGPKAPPNAPEDPLPFHLPGSDCHSDTHKREPVPLLLSPKVTPACKE